MDQYQCLVFYSKLPSKLSPCSVFQAERVHAPADQAAAAPLGGPHDPHPLQWCAQQETAGKSGDSSAASTANLPSEQPSYEKSVLEGFGIFLSPCVYMDLSPKLAGLWLFHLCQKRWIITCSSCCCLGRVVMPPICNSSLECFCDLGQVSFFSARKIFAYFSSFFSKSWSAFGKT